MCHPWSFCISARGAVTPAVLPPVLYASALAEVPTQDRACPAPRLGRCRILGGHAAAQQGKGAIEGGRIEEVRQQSAAIKWNRGYIAGHQAGGRVRSEGQRLQPHRKIGNQEKLHAARNRRAADSERTLGGAQPRA